jgi:hypothetical protein
MNIHHLPGPDDDMSQVDEREWQAQERALREERLHLSTSDPAAAGYRRIARALRTPIAAGLPADFAAHVARHVGPARLDLHIERGLLLGISVALAVAVPVVLAMYGAVGLEVAAAVFPSLSQVAPNWLFALAACVGLTAAMEPLRGRFAARR